MIAVVFDVDGTLVLSDEMDARLYVTAVRSVLGEVRLRDSWERYENVTDSAILEDICTDNQIALTAQIIRGIKARFVADIGRHIQDSGPFQEFPGARDFVLSLIHSHQCRVAYATGGWGESARLKLASAGLPLNVPLASSDDFSNRSAIMTHALSQIGRDFAKISYYGDGPWDREAAISMGWEFVPVGKELGGLSKFAVGGA